MALPLKPPLAVLPKLPLSFLPLHGDGHAPYWENVPIDETNFEQYRGGRPELVELIETAARETFQATGQPLYVNDLNNKTRKTTDHRRGIDADILVRLSTAVHFEEGSLARVADFLNIEQGENFTPGTGYDQEATMDLVRRLLQYRRRLSMRLNGAEERCNPWEPRCVNKERPQLVACVKANRKCKNYFVQVQRIFTSDPAIVRHFGANLDHQGIRIVQPWPGHANHLHVRIDFIPSR